MNHPNGLHSERMTLHLVRSCITVADYWNALVPAWAPSPLDPAVSTEHGQMGEAPLFSTPALSWALREHGGLVSRGSEGPGDLRKGLGFLLYIFFSFAHWVFALHTFL